MLWRIVLVLPMLTFMTGCAGMLPERDQPQRPERATVDREVERYLQHDGYTMSQAMGDWMNGGDALKAGNRVMLSCKTNVQSFVARRWRGFWIGERDASHFCRTYLVWSAETYLKEQEILIGALTKDPDRLPPGVRKPSPYYRERKQYDNVKTDVERMMAVLKEGLQR